MATDTDILLPGILTETKRVKVGFTSQRNLAFQGADQCNVSCDRCQSEKVSGACVLEATHTGDHRCNRGHQWPNIPGPHIQPDITGPH